MNLHCSPSLETCGRLMELDSRDGKLRVIYGDRLATLINEVRQLSSLGFDIPAKISKCADVGKKFHQHGVELQAVRAPGEYFDRRARFLSLARAFLQYHRH